jgi:hypothetical protein
VDSPAPEPVTRMPIEERRGKKSEARKLQVKISGWFTEGFETNDLQEAKALLEELT